MQEYIMDNVKITVIKECNFDTTNVLENLMRLFLLFKKNQEEDNKNRKD